MVRFLILLLLVSVEEAEACRGPVDAPCGYGAVRPLQVVWLHEYRVQAAEAFLVFSVRVIFPVGVDGPICVSISTAHHRLQLLKRVDGPWARWGMRCRVVVRVERHVQVSAPEVSRSLPSGADEHAATIYTGLVSCYVYRELFGQFL